MERRRAIFRGFDWTAIYLPTETRDQPNSLRAGDFAGRILAGGVRIENDREADVRCDGDSQGECNGNGRSDKSVPGNDNCDGSIARPATREAAKRLADAAKQRA